MRTIVLVWPGRVNVITRLPDAGVPLKGIHELAQAVEAFAIANDDKLDVHVEVELNGN